MLLQKQTLRENRLYSELFWSVFSYIWTEFGDIRSISPYSVRVLENTDQKNSKYRLFLRSENIWKDLDYIYKCNNVICILVIIISPSPIIKNLILFAFAFDICG